MPRDPIIGSGRKGFGFEQKGFQERNLQVLLETLSKKETQKSIEALSKINKDEWKAMSETATSLNNFIVLGGQVAMFNTMTKSIKETVKLQIDSLLSPLQNQINQSITDRLTPFLTDILSPMINDLTTFLSENAVGTGVGGIVGGIAAMFLPGGPLLIAIGAIIGAAIEEYFTGGDIPIPGDPITTQDYLAYYYSRGARQEAYEEAIFGEEESSYNPERRGGPQEGY